MFINLSLADLESDLKISTSGAGTWGRRAPRGAELREENAHGDAVGYREVEPRKARRVGEN